MKCSEILFIPFGGWYLMVHTCSVCNATEVMEGMFWKDVIGLVTIDGFNSWPSNILKRSSRQARMYEEARVIEVRRRQREVYERIKVGRTQNSQSPVEKNVTWCEFFIGSSLPLVVWNSKCLLYPCFTCLIPVQQPSTKTWRLERKARKEGKPLPPKGTPYVWTLEPRAKRMQLPKVSQNLLWMCWLLKMIEG